MDKFKEVQNSCCGVGGINCTCCNPYYGKTKKFLNKIARSILKRITKKEIEKEIEE